MWRRALLIAGLVLAMFSLRAAEAQILKVLPHFLDARGRHSLAPSLYERDAYQDQLRKNPGQVHGFRYDVLWKVRGKTTGPLALRLELRTATNASAKPMLLETPVKPGWRGRKWSSVKLAGEPFKAAGNVVAWRAVLLEGDQEIAEQKSFLW